MMHAGGGAGGEEQFRDLTHPATVDKKSVFSSIYSTLYFISLRYETGRSSRKIENGFSIFFCPTFSGTSIKRIPTGLPTVTATAARNFQPTNAVHSRFSGP